MAFTSSTHWNVSTSGGTDQGSGFDTGVSGFPTDGAATSATGSSPVFTSASYTFVAGDVTAWIYIKSGTNWTPGWYKIASVSAGAATLSAAIGAGQLASDKQPTIAAGCATTASPTSATWGLDYSQSDSAAITFTDMVIDGTTNTKFTSAGNPVGKNFIGNCISVNSGTGFTVQRVAVVSTVTTTATCDKSLGTLSSTGGNGKLGGAVTLISTANSVAVASNFIHIKSGTYTHTAAVVVAVATVTFKGYGTTQGDGGTRPLITTATNSINLITTSSNAGVQVFENLSLSNTAGTRASGVLQLSTHGTTQWWVFRKILFDGFSTAINSDNVGSDFDVYQIAIQATEIKNSTAYAYRQGGATAFAWISGSNFHDNVSHILGGGGSTLNAHRTVFANSTTDDGINNSGDITVTNCTLYGTTTSAKKALWGGTGNRLIALNNIFYNNNNNIFFSGAPNVGSGPMSRNNAFGSSTNGNTNWTSSPFDVTLTADPFTNAASQDFSLNSTAGGGALLKGAAIGGGALPGSTSTGEALDIGAIQTVPAVGGSGSSNFGFIG